MLPINFGKPLTKKDLAFKYVSSSDLENLQLILSEGSNDENIFATDSQGCSLLHRALDVTNNDTCVNFLLETCPQLTSKKNNSGETPLHYACGLKHTNVDTLQLLLDVNPSTINDKDNRGCTPLHIVAAGYQVENSHSNRYDEPKKDEMKRFHNFHRAALLIERGAILNSEDDNGMTPLHHTIQNSSTDQYEINMKMMELFLKHEAKLNTNSGVNSITLALKSYKVLEYILHKDQSCINKIDKFGLTPLQYLIKNSESISEILKVISLLVKYGANINSDTINLARKHDQDFSVIDMLLELVPSYDVNTKDEQGKTLLIQYSSDVISVRKLLQRGADVNEISSDGSTALLTAVSVARDPVNIVKLLLEAHANPLIFNQTNENVISIACKKFITDPSENKYYKLLEIFLNLSCFTDSTIDITSGFNNETHPQMMILKNLHVMGNRIELYKILALIMNCNFKDPTLVIECKVNNFEDLNFKNQQSLNSISCLLNSSLDKILTLKTDCCIKGEIIKILDLMITAEFIEKSPVGTVSPLTILLSFTYRELPMSLVYHANDNEEMTYGYGYPFHNEISDSDSEDQENVSVSREQLIQNEQLKLVQYFIENKVNIGDISTEIEINNYDNKSEINRIDLLEKLRKLLWLPDALWVSFLRMNVEAVKLLLPHWCGPPLALLLFNDNMNYNQIMKFLPMLLQYGGIPLGTQVSKLLQQFVADVYQKYGQHIILGEDAEAWESLNEIMSSPTSLRNLSRYAVRTYFSERASKPEENLPDLLDKISPPGLSKYLLMKL